MKALFFLTVMLFAAFPATAMTVSQAYDAISHRQTPFNPDIANMSLEDSAFLEQFFNLTDKAVRDRVQVQRHLAGKKDGISIGEYNKRHAEILKSIKALKASDNTSPVRDLVASALEDEKNVLNKWSKEKKKSSASHDKETVALIDGIHEKLVEAFLLLIKTYHYEEPQNRQAFKECLSGLDLKG